MRQLHPDFIDDLNNGCLYPILDRVRHDHTLMLAIRGDYINIYYRGGNLLKLVKKDGERRYQPFFDKKYIGLKNDELRTQVDSAWIDTSTAATVWVQRFCHLKQEMDLFFARKQKDEREFQQLILRENNFSRLANDTEVFFTDIEYAQDAAAAGGRPAFRFDMLGVQWLASDRRQTHAGRCRPVLVEVKYGDAALGGNAGLLKHYRDIAGYLQAHRTALVDLLNAQLGQLQDLELLGVKKNEMRLRVDPEAKPIVVFVLANSNPRSGKLAGELARLREAIDQAGPEADFDLRFFVSSFAGYAMHERNLFSLDEFEPLLAQLRNDRERPAAREAAEAS